ncbi:Hypothetical protein SRAE_1000066300 [Strongyloides ratti]|uniref:Uncharacterized protein n=1 Tax=Strongyloides ratti TaxID=34506 RepID=A0A090KXZ3_STRRB|nr:Hypothetical protein SRAE_1000066300 [Strongyloides ratti]CEF62390.1 Hypothetical protein SRAE_1000066300 [Strongyloides ratti]
MDKLLEISQDNRNLLNTVNEKIDCILRRITVLEEKLYANKEDRSITPSNMNCESLEIGVLDTNTSSNNHFVTDSGACEDEFYDAIQGLSLTQLDGEVFHCSLYHSYKTGSAKRISKVECSFKRKGRETVLEVINDACNVDHQIICGVEDEKMYGFLDKGNHAVVVIKADVLVCTVPNLRSILLKFKNKIIASEVYKRVSTLFF